MPAWDPLPPPSARSLTPHSCGPCVVETLRPFEGRDPWHRLRSTLPRDLRPFSASPLPQCLVALSKCPSVRPLPVSCPCCPIGSPVSSPARPMRQGRKAEWWMVVGISNHSSYPFVFTGFSHPGSHLTGRTRHGAVQRSRWFRWFLALFLPRQI